MANESGRKNGTKPRPTMSDVTGGLGSETQDGPRV
jgi:hypothetical protein